MLKSTAAAMSSARKAGSSTGGTSQLRKSNEEDFDIRPPLIEAGALALSVTDKSLGASGDAPL